MAVRRILVPLDASPDSIAALEAASDMAARQRAELLGLFVEDSDLLRYTEYGFAREVSLCSCSLLPLQKENLELQLRARSEQVRQRLARVAESRGIPWRFSVSRGEVISQILEAASQADLTVLGKVGWSLSLGKRTGSTVRAMISRSGRPTLILQQGSRLLPTAILLYTGSELSALAISAASEILRLEQYRLLVYIPAESQQDFERLSRDAGSLLPSGARAEFRHLPRPWHTFLLHELHREGAKGPLVLPQEDPDFQGRALEDFISNVSNPVLVVRQERQGRKQV